MTTTPNITVPSDVPVPASFEDVVSAWDEPLRCQSIFGCRRRAAWLAIHHKPCGGQQLVCTFHYRRWVKAAVLAIAYTGLMECHECRTTVSTIEQCNVFRPL